MEDRQEKIKSIVIVVMAWLIALAFLSLCILKIKLLLR
jgi:hypothetical protein